MIRFRREFTFYEMNWQVALVAVNFVWRTKVTHKTLFSTLLMGLALVAIPAARADQVYTSVDFPQAVATFGRGINPDGEITGSYVSADHKTHGFTSQNGVYTSIDFPNAIATTADGGPNPQGDIVGNYTDSQGKVHGYLLSFGVFTTIDFPNASGTTARYINARGEIVGFYNGGAHGFLLSGGVYTSIDFPNASFTQAGGINSEGQIVGLYGMAGKVHGFLLSNGQFTTIDEPQGLGTTTTSWDINPSGTIVGFYADTKGVLQAYVDGDGNFQTLVFPGSPTGCAFGINPQGNIVGQYTDSHGVTHGFLLSRSGTQ